MVDLSEIPWFLVCSEGEDFEGNSWTAQCEILQYRMLGGGPADEGQPPDDVEPTLFDFVGYGQPSGNAANAGNVNPNANQPVNQELAPQWGLWPDGPQAQEDGPFIGPQVAQEDPDVPIVQALAAPNPGNNDPVGNGQGVAVDNLDIDLNMAIGDDLGELKIWCSQMRK